MDIDSESVVKSYARWAPVYDLVFGKLFERARAAAIAATQRVGGRVLDVGVGTGICLPRYTCASGVVGIDLSEPMLRKARKRVAELGLTNIESLTVMDAEDLDFLDNSFDAVVAQYVVNTVPHPEAALDELARVVKPGGEIILINRVAADTGVRRALETGFAPAGHWLGWRPDFRWARFEAWLARTPDIPVDRAAPRAAARSLLAHSLWQGGHGRRNGARLTWPSAAIAAPAERQAAVMQPE
jgi:phosphatidylethanolamine/phosphatidyl-N-methylethanolamine N-methyltransferase